MSDKTILAVMKKDGESFVKLGYGQWLVNGSAPQVCRGDSSWAYVVGDITSIEHVVPRSQRLAGWKLKEAFAAVPSTLEPTRPAEAFSQYGDEDDAEPQRKFYEPVYEEQPPVVSPVEFEVIDHDCEPIERPAYVTVKFPHNVKDHPATWHKWPCEISYKQVFCIVADAIVAKCKELPDYSITDHRNIQVLRVERKIAIPPAARREVSQLYWTGRNKQKTRRVTHTSRLVKVLEIIGEYRDRHDETRTITLSGNNWAELSQKLQDYVQSFLEMLDPDHLEVCDKCKGSGVVAAMVEAP